MRSLLILLFFLTLGLTGCVGPFYESDMGKNIKLPVGTPFEVRLEGSQGNEYAWKLTGIDTNVVRMVLRPAFTPDADSNGDDGLFSFYFQTVGEGQTELELTYSDQTHEEEDAAAKRFTMQVESII